MNDPVGMLARAEERRVRSEQAYAVRCIDSLAKAVTELRDAVDGGRHADLAHVNTYVERLASAFQRIGLAREKLDLLHEVEWATRRCAGCEATGVEMRVGSTSDPEGKLTDAPFCRPCIDAGANHGAGSWEELTPFGAGKAD